MRGTAFRQTLDLNRKALCSIACYGSSPKLCSGSQRLGGRIACIDPFLHSLLGLTVELGVLTSEDSAEISKRQVSTEVIDYAPK